MNSLQRALLGIVKKHYKDMPANQAVSACYCLGPEGLIPLFVKAYAPKSVIKRLSNRLEFILMRMNLTSTFDLFYSDHYDYPYISMNDIKEALRTLRVEVAFDRKNKIKNA